jgi:ribosomal-protein-serine acetyltransferase
VTSLPTPQSVARTLHTPRLSIEPTGYQHLEGIWQGVQASLPELQEWMAWAADVKVEETRSHVAHAEKVWAGRATGELSFTVLKDGVVAGVAGLGSILQDLRRAELGYWMRSDLCGQGLMTEAASAVVEFAFRDFLLHRLELHAAPGNKGSNRVAEKLGFKLEGLGRDAGFAAAEWQDMNIYGLLETDPQPRFHVSDLG